MPCSIAAPTSVIDAVGIFPFRWPIWQIPAIFRKAIENAFHVFEGKYSILIDIRELERTMSNKHAICDRCGTHRPPSLPVLMQVTHALRALAQRYWALRRISVSWMAQSPIKMATTA